MTLSETAGALDAIVLYTITALLDIAGTLAALILVSAVLALSVTAGVLDEIIP